MNLIDRNCTQGLILWIKVDEEGARLQQEINIVFEIQANISLRTGAVYPGDDSNEIGFLMIGPGRAHFLP